MGRALGYWCVSKQSHDDSLATTPFIYLCFTTKVYWYRPVLSSGISWREQYRTCAAVVSGVYFGKIRGPGDGVWGGIYPTTNIPRFSCGIPGGKWRSDKDIFVLTGPLDIIVQLPRPFLILLSCEWHGVNYCPAWDLSFSWLFKVQSEPRPQPPPLSPAALHSWMLYCRLTRVRQRAAGPLHSSLWQLPLASAKNGQKNEQLCELKNQSVFMCLPSRVAQLTAERLGFPPGDWWQWSSRLRNPSALDCGAPRTPAETQQRFCQPQVLHTHTHKQWHEIMSWW